MVREKLSGKERARLEKLGLTEEEIASCEVLAFQSGEYIKLLKSAENTAERSI